MMLLRSCRVLNLNSASWDTNFLRASVFNYSTTTTTTPAANEKRVDSLYRRISPVGDWRVSIVPVLDQWIDEGKKVNKLQLQSIVKELRRYRRFHHALEVSQWMTDIRYFKPSHTDLAIRLELISKVKGIDQVETYFKNIPEEAKGVKTFVALLKCYVVENSLEKAEDLMQKIRNLGLEMDVSTFNLMLNLYRKTGNYEKLDSLMHEMEEKGIKFNKVTYSIRLTAYADNLDTEGIEKIIKKMESDPTLALDWNAYAIAANEYVKVGVLDKALAMLKKSEGLVLKSNGRNTGFDSLITLYAMVGNKDEVLRVWEIYKNTEKILNSGYVSMITSLLKFEDIQGAENVFEEWESNQSTYDFRIPNYLIGFYCRKGLMEKAEALINRAKENGGKPHSNTYYFLATGYVGCGQFPEALEALKMVVAVYRQGWRQPRKDILEACLEYLKGKNEVEEAKEFVRYLGDKGVVSTDVQEKLLNYLKVGKEDSEKNSLMEGGLAGDGLVDTLVGAEYVAEGLRLNYEI